MVTKNDLRDMLIHEYRVIRQLIPKIPEGSEDFRLSPPQRSTMELLHYLAIVGPGVLHAANDGGFGWYVENKGKLEGMTLADAPQYMDGAIAEMEHLFEQWTEEDLATRDVSVPRLGDWKLGTWILHSACRWVPAYKLQLFHHAKAAGNTDIGTWDAWMDDGSSPKPEG